MEIYIVRHGKTVWNKEKRLQGSTDIELTEESIRMAKETGINLMDTEINAIFSSPLKRAFTTADCIRNGRNIEINIDDRIRELCFGEFEGHTKDELDVRPGCSFKYFFTEPEKYIAPPSGEALEDAIKRAGEFMKEMVEPLANNADVKRIMIVAHGAINKAIMSYALNREIKDYWKGGLQRNCDVTILNFENGIYSLLKESTIFYDENNYK